MLLGMVGGAAGWLLSRWAEALQRRAAGPGAPARRRVPPMLVALATAALFAAAYALYGVTLLLLPRLVFICALVVLFITDLQRRILPNVVTLPGILVGVAASLLVAPGWSSSLAGIAVGGGGLFALSEAVARMRGSAGFGMGDVKMLAMIGAFLGWPLVLLTFVLASLAGSATGIAIAMARGTNAGLPFGVFLALAALAAAGAGEDMLSWYTSLYH